MREKMMGVIIIGIIVILFFIAYFLKSYFVHHLPYNPFFDRDLVDDKLAFGLMMLLVGWTIGKWIK